MDCRSSAAWSRPAESVRMLHLHAFRCHVAAAMRRAVIRRTPILPDAWWKVDTFRHQGYCDCFVDALRYLFSRQLPPPPAALPATTASPTGAGEAPTVPPVGPGSPAGKKDPALVLNR